ncbi:MAG: hypothetical protein KAT49_04675, partial [Methanomicrobia archaeon]|nr:hypothetical protein [Methanomicrobia archaeon]
MEELDIPFWRLNTEDYLSKYQINIQLSNGLIKSNINYFDGRTIETEKIKGVYFRQPIVPDLSFEIVEPELEFAQRETLEVLRSLWRIIDERLWLNHPKYLLLANNKVDQLQRAAKLGFNVPPTCISTDLDTITNFYHSFNGDIVAKAVKHGFYKTKQNVQIAPTQKIDKNLIDN